MTIPWHELPDRTVPGAAGALAMRDTGGNKPALLMLHGLGRTLLDWAPLADRLSDSYRVIAVDLRGHGKSDAAPFDWEGFLDDVDSVIKELGLDSCVLVGHSLGALLAVMYGKSRGGASAVVCIEGPRPSGPSAFVDIDPGVAVERLALYREWQKKFAGDAMSAALAREQIDAMAEAQVQRFSPYPVEPELIREAWYRGVQGDEESGFRFKPTDVPPDLFSQVDTIDLFADIRSVAVPLQVWFADQELPEMPPIPELPWMAEMTAASVKGYYKALDDLRRDRPQVDLQMIEGSHMVMLERPDDVVAQIRAFLAVQGFDAGG